jgi:DNA-binding CsgD family transcriptional regulator
MPDGFVRPQRIAWDIAVAVGTLALLIWICMYGVWWGILGICLFVANYLILGRRVITAEHPNRLDLPFIVGLVVSGTVCTGSFSALATLQALICPMLWLVTLDRRRAAVANAVLVVAEFLALTYYYPINVLNLVVDGLIETLIFCFSMAIGFWITGLERKMQAAHVANAAAAQLEEPEPTPLSARELEVLELAAKGLTNQQIADELFITVATTKTHIQHILAKMEVPNRTLAVAKAKASRWL